MELDLENDQDLDPRVRDYLTKMMARGNHLASPEYGREMASLRQADMGQAISRAQLGGVAEGLSKLGTLGGKSPDVKPVTTTLDKLDKAAGQRNAYEAADADDEQKQLGMNSKVYEYLQGRTDKTREAEANRDLKMREGEANREARSQEADANREFRQGMANIAGAARAGRDDARKDKDYFSNVDSLQRQYDMDPEVKKTKEVQSSSNAINTLAKSTPSAQSDQSLIFNWMKLQDPGSVVRESEYAAAEATRGLTDKAGAYFQKMNNGELLTPEQRKRFVEESQNLARGYAGRMSQINKQFQDRAARRKVENDDLRFVVEANEALPPGGGKEAPGGGKEAPGGGGSGTAIAKPAGQTAGSKYKDGATKTIKGVTYIRKGGEWEPMADDGGGDGAPD